ncbi:MAG: type III-A CRISPR-associated protein Cas10/Csm1 [Bacteroidetes bacterium]|nr:type III-A CRISPR-associated protein Cas10/Csm1 [Bacteroidota bacterium]
MDQIRNEIYLAALLHDIGKFWQRADDAMDSPNNRLSQNTRNNAGNICRKAQGGYFTHLHVLWTSEFLTLKEKRYPFLKDLHNLAVYHHNPSTEQESIIQIADWWASGIDRSYEEGYQHLDFGKQRFRRQPIGNVFSILNVDNSINNNGTQENKSSFLLNPLNIDVKRFYPQPYIDENANAKEEYGKLWEAFFNEFDMLPDGNISYFANSLLYLVKKYCWSIPAATNEDFPFNSLFDHSKVTAAIAWSLMKAKDENPKHFIFNTSKKKMEVLKGALPLLLVCVDLSGIQKFLYDISSKYAAKSLRGRSFYLQALLDDIARELLHITGAFNGNIVYSSGGKFYMLLPNTKSITDTLDTFEQKLLTTLWDKYKGGLYLCFGRIAFAYDNNINKRKPNIWLDGEDNPVYLYQLWMKATQNAALKKRKRFSNLLTTESKFKEFFDPTGQGGNNPICQVTGLEMETLTEVEGEDEFKVTQAVKEQKEIGERLVGHNVIIYSTEQTYLSSQKSFQMITDHRLIIDTNTPKNIERAEIYSTLQENEPDFLTSGLNNKNIYGFKYFGGSSYPISEGAPKTFEDLVGNSSFKRLGVLRMDVDNLGNLFTKGFLHINEHSHEVLTDKSSFSAYATLSGMLDLFFSGYINTIRNTLDYKDWVSIIYSGGDDLFAVGRWDKMIGFANDVNIAFKRLTGRNDITLSAGLVLVSQKFPIAKSADLAGIAEDVAKQHVYDNHVKNSLTLFDIPVNWDHEFSKVSEMKVQLVKWLQNDVITKGLLMQLLKYYNRYKFQKKSYKNNDELTGEDLSWKWQVAYNLARRRNATNDVEKRAALDYLKNLIFTEVCENKLRFDAFALACRWAELENRMKN